MKIWIERALAALRWGWEKLVAFGKVAFAKLQVIFNTVYDPPPKTIRFWFWSWAALMFVAWLTFAFTNSWFYKPTVAYFSSFVGEDVSYVLPEPTPLPSVATPAVEVPSVEVVCHDMSDTPQCEPVQLPSEKSTEGTQIEEEANSIPAPVAKPKLTSKARKKVNRRKHQPYVTYWGF
jgi:hypothetical protein